MNGQIIAPIMDARRNQVYTAFYKWEDDKFIRISEYMADDIKLVLKKLSRFDKNVVFLGDGVEVYKDIIIEFNSNFIFAPSHINAQRASAVGALAMEYARSGVVDPKDFELIYLRKSQAEREFDEREKSI